MTWLPLFFSAGFWTFFGIHFLFSKHLEEMLRTMGNESADSHPMIVGSKVIGVLGLLNLVVFFFYAGFKIGWIYSTGVFIGGWLLAQALVYAITLQGPFNPQFNLLHKAGWIAIPALSIGIWFV